MISFLDMFFFERVYINLHRDGYVPIDVAEINFKLAAKQILTKDMKFSCFIPCSTSAHRPTISAFQTL